MICNERRESVTQEQIKYDIKRQLWKIAKTLQAGDRVELIPRKDSVKVLRICRTEISEDKNKYKYDSSP